MQLNKLILIIFFINLSSCSNKKDIRSASTSHAKTSEDSMADDEGDKGGLEDVLVSQGEQEEGLEITNISLEGLIDSVENELEANTTVATIKAEFSDGSASDLDVNFQILETIDTDYELFEVSGSTLSNIDVLAGDKRFALHIKAEKSGSTFETNILFSIAAGKLPPESPQNIVFQPELAIGEDNLVGSFTVVDDERFEHVISLVENEEVVENDNALFTITEDKLFTSDTFAWKDSFTIQVEAQNNEFEDLKFATEITFSIAELELGAEDIVDVDFLTKTWAYSTTGGNMAPNFGGNEKAIKDQNNNKLAFTTLEDAKNECEKLANCHRVWQVNGNYVAGNETYTPGNFYLFETGINPTLVSPVTAGVFHTLYSTTGGFLAPDAAGNAKVIKDQDNNKLAYPSLQEAQTECDKRATCRRVWELGAENTYSAAGESYSGPNFYLFETGVYPTDVNPYGGKFYNKVVAPKNDPSNY
ncbi:MAG: hypothetical protein AB8G05_08820 [Oligoflexales bacterium]